MTSSSSASPDRVPPNGPRHGGPPPQGERGPVRGTDQGGDRRAAPGRERAPDGGGSDELLSMIAFSLVEDG